MGYFVCVAVVSGGGGVFSGVGSSGTFLFHLCFFGVCLFFYLLLFCFNFHGVLFSLLLLLFLFLWGLVGNKKKKGVIMICIPLFPSVF